MQEIAIAEKVLASDNVINTIVQYGLPSALLILFIFLCVYLINLVRSSLVKQVDMQQKQIDFNNNSLKDKTEAIHTIALDVKSGVNDIKNSILDIKSTILNYDHSIIYNFQEIDANIKKYFIDIEHKTEKLANLLNKIDEKKIDEIIKSTQSSLESDIEKLNSMIEDMSKEAKCTEEASGYILDMAKNDTIKKVYRILIKLYRMMKEKK
ncbi:MAG: hypothetical protein WC933_03310 [Candidatus Paceibacterota bacterium]|jgi:acetolactate synthase small subunit